MESGTTPGMEELKGGQQEIQEKIVRMTKMVTNLTKGKGITADPSLQREPTSWKNNDGQFTVLNSNNHCEQEKLRKDPFGRS